MTNPWTRRIPRQRETKLRTIGQPPADLCSQALNQWEVLMKNERTFRALIYGKTGSTTHVDDVWAKVMSALHARLRKSPIDNVIPYVKRVCRNEAVQHLQALAKRAEDFVGDDTYKLEDEALRLSVDPTTRVQFDQALKVLREELTPHQLTIYVLTEAYDLDSRTVAGLLGGTASAAAVRGAHQLARQKLQRPAVRLRLGLDPGWAKE